MNNIDPVALFRLSVLGPIVSRERLERGELQLLLRQLALQEYAIPGSRRRHIGERTLQTWYYAWRREGVAGLASRPRADTGRSKLPEAVQAAVLAAKRENPQRSIRQIRLLLESAGVVARGTLSRCAVHRLLKVHGLSRIVGPAVVPQEKRSFVAEYAGSIWYGDVMHGPMFSFGGARRKTYLVSLFDDASRLVAHSAFCLSETALEIEGVLKQALLRRGIPRMIVVDNGSAYRAASLQTICADLDIRLVHCQPYQPTSKGKLERWHRTVRDQFLAELDATHIRDLADLNSRLWAWVEQVYHREPHSSLGKDVSPLARYQQDLPRIRALGSLAPKLDELFLHRVERHVRRDGTVSYDGRVFEVPYELSGQRVVLVVDPHAGTVLRVQNSAGQPLGAATPLDAVANSRRRRSKPPIEPTTAAPVPGPNLIELTHQHHYRQEG
ncbi:DDE-type integrase/transposase/recombinase [Cupriavidus necator]|nr:DDE-type integrase/transposase/recombinase [Cupriavidus necator]UIF88292.1 DDE-type integrase/transposase/recombinase [Cupriavidus necator]UIF88526.1 DDE-type integrase/transposase/recombinase [Cupriavidus necator]UIF88909.1 DDE-type integrase/transposase/recombinase [Cupriavidus necator]UIF89022.1 DDE-type integrase/transposase/recombinase [Cupriavidus necator]